MCGSWVTYIRVISEEFAKMQIPCLIPVLFLIQKFRQWAKELAFSVSPPGDFYAHWSMRTPVSEIIRNSVRRKCLHCQEGTTVHPSAFIFPLSSTAQFFCLTFHLWTLIIKLYSCHQTFFDLKSRLILLHFFPVEYIPKF